MTAACVRCGQPVEAGRRKYCSDACADSSMRDRIKAGKSQRNLVARKLFRYYPKQDP